MLLSKFGCNGTASPASLPTCSAPSSHASLFGLDRPCARWRSDGVGAEGMSGLCLTKGMMSKRTVLHPTPSRSTSQLFLWRDGKATFLRRRPFQNINLTSGAQGRRANACLARSEQVDTLCPRLALISKLLRQACQRARPPQATLTLFGLDRPCARRRSGGVGAGGMSWALSLQRNALNWKL